MTHSNTAFHQLLKPLSRHEFEAEAKKHHVGQKLRSASRWDQFVGMAMSQLSGRQSLRDIQSNSIQSRNTASQTLSPGCETHSTIHLSSAQRESTC